MSTAQHRRIERLEQTRASEERLRVVAWCPSEPRPRGSPDELLVIVKRYGPGEPAGTPVRGTGATA